MHSDPISDLLTRIRNASAAGHQSCKIPYSRIKFELAEVLKKNEYIGEVKSEGDGIAKEITIEILPEKTAFTNFRRISSPGRRVYKKVSDIFKVKNGLGISIISTPKGLLTDKEARKEKVGGELLCEVW